MKRDFLSGLELEKETIDKIMAEYGKSIERYKADKEQLEVQIAGKDKELETLNGQLTKANTEIESYKELDVEEIKARAKKYEEDYEALKAESAEELDRLKFSHELDGALRDIGARNTTAVKALLDTDTLYASNNRAQDIQAALENVKKDNDYLFESANPRGTGGSMGGGSRGASQTITKEDLAGMSYTERVKFKRESPELYKELTK